LTRPGETPPSARTHATLQPSCAPRDGSKRHANGARCFVITGSHRRYMMRGTTCRVVGASTDTRWNHSVGYAHRGCAPATFHLLLMVGGISLDHSQSSPARISAPPRTRRQHDPRGGGWRYNRACA
jgi:hypothetical protein